MHGSSSASNTSVTCATERASRISTQQVLNRIQTAFRIAVFVMVLFVWAFIVSSFHRLSLERVLGNNDHEIQLPAIPISLNVTNKVQTDINRNNPWFRGVLEDLRPLGHQCDISHSLRDIEDVNNAEGRRAQYLGRRGNNEDVVADILTPFERRGMDWKLPCIADRVRVTFSATLRMWPPPQNWRHLLPHEASVHKDGSTVVALNESDTQVWYTCRGSGKNVLTYSLGVNVDHADKQRQTAYHFYSHMGYNEREPPPSLYILVMDSTSRASFHRSFPSIVEALRADNGVDVLEMFRYSSLAWGTNANTMTLMRGCAKFEGIYEGRGSEQCTGKHVPLHLWYAAAGYVLLGNYSYSPVFAENPWYYGEIQPLVESPEFHRLQLDAYVDLVLEQIKYYDKHAPGLPRYFAAHLEDNHSDVNDGFKGQESALRRLLEGIGFARKRSVLLMIADHGKYNGRRASTSLGTTEASNPVNIAVVSRGVLTEAQRAQWRDNQQVLASHHEMHATLKSLPLQFAPFGTLPKVNAYCSLNGKEGATFCERKDFDESTYCDDRSRNGCRAPPWKANLLTSSLPQNRTCSDAGVPDLAFCFCGSMTSEGSLSPEQRTAATKKAVDSLNAWTGYGETECAMFREDDFRVASVMSYVHGELKGNVIITLSSTTSKASFLVELDNKMSIAYHWNKYGMYAPKIIRQDQFSEEPCLITYTDGRMPKFKSGRNSTGLLLRWCSCNQ